MTDINALLKRINEDLTSVKNIGNDTFSGCSSLTSISIPEWCEVQKYAFSRCPENLVITRY